MTEFVLKTEFIKLDALLKAVGAAPTGGVAKEMIQSGAVTVDGKTEDRRGTKIRAGAVVKTEGYEILVKGAEG